MNQATMTQPRSRLWLWGAADGQLPPHRLLAASQHHHRLGLALQQRRKDTTYVLDFVNSAEEVLYREVMRQDRPLPPPPAKSERLRGSERRG